MRNVLLIPILAFTFSNASAQAEKPEYKSVAKKFEAFYNKGSYDSIFVMFSADMKKALPAGETRTFLESLKTRAGKIIKREFRQYLRTYAFYKATFEKEVLALKISLDSESKINGLLVNPYGD